MLSQILRAAMTLSGFSIEELRVYFFFKIKMQLTYIYVKVHPTLGEEKQPFDR
jgi:hypothetical protein